MFLLIYYRRLLLLFLFLLLLRLVRLFRLRDYPGVRYRGYEQIYILDVQYVEQDPYFSQDILLVTGIRKVANHVLQAVHPPRIVMAFQAPYVEAALELFLGRVSLCQEMMSDHVFLRRKVYYVGRDIRAVQSPRDNMVLLVDDRLRPAGGLGDKLVIYAQIIHTDLKNNELLVAHGRIVTVDLHALLVHLFRRDRVIRRAAVEQKTEYDRRNDDHHDKINL